MSHKGESFLNFSTESLTSSIVYSTSSSLVKRPIPNLIELTGAAIQTWAVEMDPMAITDCPREPEMLVARKSSRLNSTADASHDVAESLRADTDGVGEASESKSDRAELIDAALLSLLAE